MPPETNPQTIKTKSGKLGAFARGISDSDAHYNAPVSKPEAPPKRSDTPVLPSSAPTREDMAKNARIPLPQVSRRTVPAQGLSVALTQPRPPSPKKHAQQPLQKPSVQPGNVRGRDPAPDSPKPHQALVSSRRDLFAGSQLGDDFMASGLTSGLTTPHNELHEDQSQHDAVREASPMRPSNQADGHAHDRVYQRELDSGLGPIQVEGRYLTVKGLSSYNPPAYMADGFQSGTQQHRNHYRADHGHAPAPWRHPARLATREEPRKTRGVHMDIKQDGARNPSVDYPDGSRHRLLESDEQGPAVTEDVKEHTAPHGNVFPDVHETPKAPRRNTSTKKRSLVKPPIPAELASPPPSRKRVRASPDYNDTVLGTKTFSELQEEPFDLDPAKTVILNGVGSEGDHLTRRLEKIQNQPERDQRAYFSTMPLDEWEASGDWFVEQFSSLMNRFKDARKEKRRVVQEFEAEAARREEVVRLRTEAIDDKLVKMRDDGQRVVGSRVL